MTLNRGDFIKFNEGEKYSSDFLNQILYLGSKKQQLVQQLLYFNQAKPNNLFSTPSHKKAAPSRERL